MRKNVGYQDRIVRGMLAIGAIVGSYVVGFTTAWGIVLLVVTAIMFLTATTAWCLIYRVLGLSTLKQEQEPFIEKDQHIRHAA